MKKQLLLAALVSASLSVWAVKPVGQLEGIEQVKVQPVTTAETKTALSVVAPQDVTEATEAIIGMPKTLYFMGMAPDGYQLLNNIGQTSAYENLTFKSLSTGANSVLWTYVDFWGEPVVGDDGREYFATANSTADSITYSAPLSLESAPTLKAVGPTYIDEIDLEVDKRYPSYILYGGYSALTNQDQRSYGMTTNSRMSVGTPSDPDRYFYRGHVLGYDPTSLGEDKRPVVDAMWGDYLTNMYTEEDPTTVISNVNYTGFGTWLPAPASPYQITHVWLYAYGQFTGAGTLTLEVMTLDDDNQPLDVVATGTCDFTSETSGGLFLFPLSSVDENGFEVDEPVTIDTKIAFVLRNLNDEPNIKTLMPMVPAGFTFSKDDKNPFYADATNMNLITYEIDGNTVTYSYRAPWSYYDDDALTNLMAPTCYLFFCDAAFGYCIESGATVAEPVITKPVLVAGGELTVTLESLYEMSEENISVECDWLSCELGEHDSKTGAQALTILVDPADAPREGSIIVSAPVARPVEIRIVVQVDAAIDGVAADATVVATKYFDLQGRELKAQPENGISIRKDIKADGSFSTAKVIR